MLGSRKNWVWWLAAFICFFQAKEVKAQLLINEFLASNSALAFDPDFGEFADYIELYNASGSTLNLRNYSITDRPGNPTKWRFPEIILQPGQFLVLWADGRNKIPGDTAFSQFQQRVIACKALHLSFGLSRDGEYIGLFNAQGQKLDEVYFGVQEANTPRGRDPLNPGKWLYYAEASPGVANSIYGAETLIFADPPQFSVNEGFHPAAFALQITPANQQAEVRFTFDGSVPNLNSAIFPGSFNVIRNYVVRARAYEPGKLPSPVVTKTYLIGENIALPVISFATNNVHFYGFDFGIYRNAIREREVPAHIEYFDTDKKTAFATGIGVRVFGTTIFSLPQRPLSVRFRSRMGDPELHYQLFDDRSHSRFKSFQLRNGGNDYNLSYFRDGLGLHLMKDHMDSDYQAYKPCVVFVNGEYMGIYEIRERMDSRYLEANRQVNRDGVDMLEDSLDVVSGDGLHYAELLKFIEKNDLKDSANYAHVSSQIDVNQYLNYMIHRIFIGYKIFEVNNKYWRPRTPTGKWRWLANDMEHAFGQLSGDNFDENTLTTVTGENDDLPEWATFLFSHLLENQSFKDLFIQRFAGYLNTIYQPQRTIAVTDSMRNLIATQMPRHILRWGTPVNLQQWNRNIDFIKEFLDKRPASMRKHIASHFGVQDSARVRIEVIGKGKVWLSGVAFADTVISGHYFKGAQLELLAAPDAGYRFVKWEGITADSSFTRIDISADTAFKVYFEEQTISIIPPLIASDTLLSAALSPWHALEDIVILPGAKLMVAPGVEILMSDKASFMVNGSFLLEGSADEPILIKSNTQSWARIPLFNPHPRWGVIAGEKADSIGITYNYISGSGFGPNRNRHFATVSAYNSQVHISHTHISDNVQPFISDSSGVYIGHSRFRSENSCDLIIIYNTEHPLVEYNDLEGNEAPDTDGVDYMNVRNGIIRNNRIYGFRGNNSDGIDINRRSQNILVEGNIIYGNSDKGISIGSGSNAIVRRNVIFNCNMGIALKDRESYAFIDQNTLYGNNYGITAYEKTTGRDGAKADVRNTITAASQIADIEADALSEINIRYSLSDRELLPGIGNRMADPEFIAEERANFELQNSSPCIDAGDPDAPADPDGSRADIGAYYTHTFSNLPQLIINEINYESAPAYNAGDWVEIYNAGAVSASLKGWKFQYGLQSFEIRSDIILPAGEYLVIAADTARFFGQNLNAARLLADRYLSLQPALTRLSLSNERGEMAYQMRLGEAPLPGITAGKGATLERIPGRRGIKPEDWRESYVLSGTPGAENSTPPDVSGLFINEIMAANPGVVFDEFGEADDWIELYNAGDDSLQIGGLYFTDNFQQPNKWQIPLHFPELTVIPPKGFLLLWADGQPQQGVLHAAFQLSSAGEQAGIYQRANGSGYRSFNRLSFGAQTPEQTFGRYPDGSDSLAYMRPTPRASNQLITRISENRLTEVRVFPNPFSTHVTFETAGLTFPFQIVLVNASGAEVWRSGLINEPRFEMPRQHLSPGLYLYRIQAKDGTVATGKLIAH